MALPGFTPGSGLEDISVIVAEKERLFHVKWAYERLKREITGFQDELNTDEEIGLAIVTSGGVYRMRIEDLGYHGPDFMIYYGRSDEGLPMRIVQHTSQTNVCFIAIKVEPGRKARRIGFDHGEEDETEDENSA